MQSVAPTAAAEVDAEIELSDVSFSAQGLLLTHDLAGPDRLLEYQPEGDAKDQTDVDVDLGSSQSASTADGSDVLGHDAESDAVNDKSKSDKGTNTLSANLIDIHLVDIATKAVESDSHKKLGQTEQAQVDSEHVGSAQIESEHVDGAGGAANSADPDVSKKRPSKPNSFTPGRSQTKIPAKPKNTASSAQAFKQILISKQSKKDAPLYVENFTSQDLTKPQPLILRSSASVATDDDETFTDSTANQDEVQRKASASQADMEQGVVVITPPELEEISEEQQQKTEARKAQELQLARKTEATLKVKESRKAEEALKERMRKAALRKSEVQKEKARNEETRKQIALQKEREEKALKEEAQKEQAEKEQARKEENDRKIAEALKLEEARKVAKIRQAAEAKRIEQARQAEEERKIQEQAAEAVRRAEEARKAKEAGLALEARRAESVAIAEAAAKSDTAQKMAAESDSARVDASLIEAFANLDQTTDLESMELLEQSIRIDELAEFTGSLAEEELVDNTFDSTINIDADQELDATRNEPAEQQANTAQTQELVTTRPDFEQRLAELVAAKQTSQSTMVELYSSPESEMDETLDIGVFGGLPNNIVSRPQGRFVRLWASVRSGVRKLIDIPKGWFRKRQ